MACECGEKYLRVYPARNNYSVSLCKEPQAAPLQWHDEKLSFCVLCGDITARMPQDVLKVIQESVSNEDGLDSLPHVL
jgi:predicted AlkP superfamily phosphohydrolase/phosphomutase